MSTSPSRMMTTTRPISPRRRTRTRARRDCPVDVRPTCLGTLPRPTTSASHRRLRHPAGSREALSASIPTALRRLRMCPGCIDSRSRARALSTDVSRLSLLGLDRSLPSARPGCTRRTGCCLPPRRGGKEIRSLRRSAPLQEHRPLDLVEHSERSGRARRRRSLAALGRRRRRIRQRRPTRCGDCLCSSWSSTLSSASTTVSPVANVKVCLHRPS